VNVAEQPAATEARRGGPLASSIRGSGWVVALLLTIGSSRVIAAAGVPLAMGYVLQQRDWSKESVGLVQSAFMAGIGLAGLACSIGNLARWERILLWLPCLLSVPMIVLIPRVEGLALGMAMTACGFLIGLGLPVFVSTGQRLLPASTRVASSITMGVSWGIGGGIVAVVIGWCEQRGEFLGAFALFATAALMSCGLCSWISPPPASLPGRSDLWEASGERRL
jgi:FSR family fosmidomycin resistance protein-like MFS transporter